MRYRKKPIVVEAFQLNSRGLVGEDWFWDAVSRRDITTYFFGKFHPEHDAYCDIKTLEGTMRANTGDYIIRGVNGEIYPCKADIFKKTYEFVDESDKHHANVQLESIKKQIADFKRCVKSENSDYLTGYISALSAVEGMIEEVEE